MSESKKDDRRVITWRQADYNLCLVAAEFIQSIQWIRTENGETEWQPSHDSVGEIGDVNEIEKDYEDYGFFIWQNEPHDSTGRQFPRGTWTNHENSTIWTGKAFGCPQCFYSLVNITRLVLKKQRLMLYKNLFGKGEKSKTSKQSSRNPEGRGESKHDFKND